MSDRPDFNDKDFQTWLKDKDINFEGLSDDEKKEKWEDFQKNNTKEGELKVSQNQNSDNAETNIVMHQEQKEPTPEHETWIEKKRNSWQPWCEQEHNPAYIYDENKEFKTGLEFDVYKTQQDKEEGKKEVSVHYDSPRDVTLTTEKGKAPDYEFFAKLAKEAKSDNIPGITFEGEMTPDFKARLAVACLENGLNIENGPENIDVNLLGQDISDDLKKKIETYNNKQFYKKAKEEARAYRADRNNEGKPFDIKDKTPKEAAMLFAAYNSEGIRVSGSFEALEANGGYFPTENLEFMSKEELQPLKERNNRQKSIVEARDKLNKLKNGNKLEVSAEEMALLQERLETENMRAEKLSKLSGINNDTAKSEDEKKTEREAVIAKYQPELKGRKAKRNPLIEAYKNRNQNS